MTRDELVERDAQLLEDTRLGIIADPDSVSRNPAWGRDYDPMAILADPDSHPKHVEVALANVRIALNPGESWSKCANCGRIYLVGVHGETVCSRECFDSYLAYVNNP